VKLLLDEMFAPTIAEQLRARGRDVASVHDPEYRALEGEPDDEVWATAIADGRVLVSENVRDFRLIEAAALERGEPTARVIFTTDRQFPRGDSRTVGRLLVALDTLLAAPADPTTVSFLKPSTAR